MTMKALLIGCGSMGLRHAQVLKNMDINLSGVLDPSENALENGIEQGFFTPEAAYTDTDLFFSHQSAELVIIATTAPYHRDYLLRCAEVGAKYVLCEKPLASSLAQCDKMIDYCNTNEIACAVNHQRRYVGQYQRIKELIDDPSFGPLTSFQVLAGNFGIAMNGSHCIEIASHLFGERFETVTAWMDEGKLPNPRGKEFSDLSGSFRATTASGKRLYIDAGNDQGHGAGTLLAARNGLLMLDELLGTMHVSKRKADHLDAPTTRYAMPYDIEDNTYKSDIFQITQAILEAMIEGREYPSLQDGRHTIEVLVAAHVSNESGNRGIRIDQLEAHQERIFPWA